MNKKDIFIKISVRNINNSVYGKLDDIIMNEYIKKYHTK